MRTKAVNIDNEQLNSLVRKIILYEREQQQYKPQEKKPKIKKEKTTVESKPIYDAYEQAIDASKYDKILADLIAD